MKKKPNVLHINSYYAQSNFYKNLYECQKKEKIGLQVYIPVANNFKSECDYGEYSHVSEDYKRIDRIFFYRKHNKIYDEIQKKYDFRNIDIIHAHSLFSNGYIALKLKEKFGIPYIVAIRNTDVNIFFKYMIHLRKLGKKIMEGAEKIIFISEPYKELVLEEYFSEKEKTDLMKKSEVIPNGIDDFWIKNRKVKEKFLNNKQLKLLYVGEINRNKNTIRTIRAIKMLQKKNYKIKFSIAGRISKKKIYEKIIKNNFVRYLGELKKEDLIEIYKKNDIFIMPSIHETFGLVYVEAMSQGLPIIYTKGQGFDNQFAKGEVGVSVKAKHVEEIAKSIEKIVENYEKISMNCTNGVEKFKWDNIQLKYKEIYIESLNERGEKNQREDIYK